MKYKTQIVESCRRCDKPIKQMIEYNAGELFTKQHEVVDCCFMCLLEDLGRSSDEWDEEVSDLAREGLCSILDEDYRDPPPLLESFRDEREPEFYPSLQSMGVK